MECVLQTTFVFLCHVNFFLLRDAFGGGIDGKEAPPQYACCI